MSDQPDYENYDVELQQQHLDCLEAACDLYRCCRYDGKDESIKILCAASGIDFRDVVAMVQREAA